MEISRDNHNYR